MDQVAPPISDPLKDRELLIRLLEQSKSSMIDESNLMWESMKYFTTLITALITVDVGLIGAFTQLHVGNPLPFFLLSIVIPAFLILLALGGERDFSRRWDRFMGTVATTSKLENALGLHSEIAGRLTILEKDHYLFPERYIADGKCKSTEEFTKASRGNTRNMFTQMKFVYSLMVLIGVLLVAVNVYALMG